MKEKSNFEQVFRAINLTSDTKRKLIAIFGAQVVECLEDKVRLKLSGEMKFDIAVTSAGIILMLLCEYAISLGKTNSEAAKDLSGLLEKLIIEKTKP